MIPPFIHPAVASEAGAIANLMQTAMSAQVRRITILGSPRLQHWVAGQIEDPTGDAFLVAEAEGRVAGMVSSRVVGGTRVLNHLYTDAALRRRGIARALLAEAVRGEVESVAVAVDVFTESGVARQWYAALGFAVENRRVWLECALPAPGGAHAGSVDGLTEADAAQARHGFSQFRLTTAHGEYAVRRLAEAVFRVADFAILADYEALAALAALNPRRALLCVGAPQELPRVGRIVEESERLTVSRTRLVAAFGGL